MDNKVIGLLGEVRNVYIFFMLSLVLGCSPNHLNVKYIGSTHELKELNGKGFRSVSVYEVNTDGSLGCCINYYKRQSVPYTSIVSLEKSDTVYFEIHNSLNCLLIQGKRYLVISDFLGQTDTLQITW
ncbi:hypothetical protein ACE38W_09950 [Chitinophaga sp. Hz27]|uniref:hypothetical protein n=1 Tax=Chitinophaga sp. Hz27 TaxID=3347169 RepID=UPI0035D5933F